MSIAMRTVVAVPDFHVAVQIRELLKATEFAIVCETDNLDTLIDCVADTTPDFILVDWNMPDFYPDMHISALRFFALGAKVIIVCTNPEPMRYAMKMGADGFVCKDELASKLPALLASFQDDMG